MALENQSRFYQKSKRNLYDSCNICGELKQLTYDHVPPKCCFNDMIAKPVEALSGQTEKYNQFCTQNGVKYRSICAQCNSDLAKYDKSIEEFVSRIKTILSSGNYSSPAAIPIRTNSMAKSICGHFLSMKNNYDSGCIIDQKLREYVLSPSACPPHGYKLLMRYYPFTTVFAMRDAVVLHINTKYEVPEGTISVLSSFPVAFVLCENSSDCGMVDLFQYCSDNIQEVSEIIFDFSSAFFPEMKILRGAKWPCNISDDDYGVPGILCSKNAVDDSVFANRDSNAVLKKFAK